MAITVEKLTVDVEADTAQAEAKLLSFRAKTAAIMRSLDNKSVSVSTGDGEANLNKLSRSSSRASGMIGNLTKQIAQMSLKIGLVAVAAGPAATGIAAIGAAAVAAVGALGPMVGLLGALPGLLGVLAQGIGVVAMGFGGIGGAMKAFATSEKAAGAAAVGGAKKTAAAAKQRAAAARAVRDATKALAEAEKDAAEGVADATDRVTLAKERLANSQEEALEAQANLTAARAKALVTLEDLTEAVENNALAERRARLRLTAAQAASAKANQQITGDNAAGTAQMIDAQRRLADSQKGLQATDAEREEASINLSQAEIDLREAIQAREKSQVDLATAQRVGIEGDLGVIAAHKAVDAAGKEVVKSNRDLQKSFDDVAKAQVDGANRIAAAQDNLADAMERTAEAADDMGSAGSAASNAFKDAMAKLTPVGRELVNTLLSFKEPIKVMREAIQEAMFPGLIEGLKAVKPLFATMTPVLAETGKVFGDFFATFGKFVSSPEFSSLLVQFGKANNGVLKTFLAALIPLTNALVNLAVAFMPLVQWLADLTLGFANWLDGVVTAKKEGEGFGGMIEKIKESCRLFWNIIKPMAVTLYNVFKAAAPIGESLLKSFGLLNEEGAAWTGNAENQKKMTDKFREFEPVIRAIAGFIGDLMKAFGRIALDNIPGTLSIIDKLKNDMLPAVETLIGKVGQFGPQIVDFLVQFVRFLNSIPLGTFTAFIGLLGNFVKGLRWGVENIPGLDKLLAIAAGFAALTMTGRALGVISKFLGLTGLAKFAKNLWDVFRGTKALSSLVPAALGGGAAAAAAAGTPAVVGGAAAAAKGGGAGGAAVGAGAGGAAIGGAFADDVVKGATKAPWLSRLKGVFKTGGGRLLPALGAGMAGYDLFTDIKSATDKGLDKADRDKAKREAVGGGIGMGIGAAIGSVFPVVGTLIGAGLGQMLGKWLSPVGGPIADATQWATNGGWQIMQGLWDGITEKAVEVWHWFIELKDKILGHLDNAWDWLWGKGKDIIKGAINGIVEGAKEVWSWFERLKEFIFGAIGKAGDAARWLWDKGWDIAKGIINGIVEGAKEIWKWFENLSGYIFGAIGDVSGWLWDKGKQIVTGLWNGIDSLRTWIADKIWSFIKDNVLGSIVKAIVPGSPSKVTTAYGKQIGMGLAMGILSTKKAVYGAAGELMGAMDTLNGGTTTFGVSPGSKRTGGINIGGVTLNVDARGATDPDAVGAAVAGSGEDMVAELLRVIRSA